MKLMEDTSAEKLRGGFYTPVPISQFILRWAVNGNSDFDILEPSCGDGVFLSQIKKSKFSYRSITAIELVSDEAEKTKNIGLFNTTVLNQDFYKYCNKTKDRFDLIIGNPPYIRYQFFDKEQRNEAEQIFQKAGLKYSKLTNAWVSFVVGSSLLLKETGKIGFVLPAELLQVAFAQQLRKYLAHFFNKVNIVSFTKLVFPNIEQEVIILLCEKNNTGSHLIEHIEIDDISQLEALDITRLKSPKKTIDFKSNKWTFYFLEQREIDFIEKLLQNKSILPFRAYADVEVGMTTGSNEFFTVSSETLKSYNLRKYAVPLVGRSVQVPSVILTKNDWKNNTLNGTRAYFLKFPSIKDMMDDHRAIEYLKYGESIGVNRYYKCRIREEWHIVPSTWVSDALFLRRSNIFPKFVINDARAYTTDTMHRVTVKKNSNLANLKNVNIKALVASYYNSLSFAFAEISGRSHGAGVLELMPSEVENVLLPYSEENASLLNDIDSMMRTDTTIDEILGVTDPIILKEGYGFSDADIGMSNKVWKTLLNRRLKRNHS